MDAETRIANAEAKIDQLLTLYKQTKAEEVAACPAPLRERFKTAMERRTQLLRELKELEANQTLIEERGAANPRSEYVEAIQTKRTGGPADNSVATDSKRLAAFGAGGQQMIENERGYTAPRAEDAEIPVGEIPHALRKCREYLESHSIPKKIFYREPQDKAAVDSLHKRLETGEDVNISSVTKDGLVVGRVMMRHFQAQKEPLIPKEITDRFSSLKKVPEDSAALPEQLHQIVHSMPKDKFQTFKWLMEFLSAVSQEHEQHRMEVFDLAEVWSPVLFRHNSSVNVALRVCMKEYSFVFAPYSKHRTFAAVKLKAAIPNQSFGSVGYQDNRYDYMARGYS